ncbi:hypothetical protein [Nocardioides sp.]|uniref:hypothetical protein n=1 Tax=Nocardioides sp. TaxID=35761 RepID=UPI002F41DEEA
MAPSLATEGAAAPVAMATPQAASTTRRTTSGGCQARRRAVPTPLQASTTVAVRASQDQARQARSTYAASSTIARSSGKPLSVPRDADAQARLAPGRRSSATRARDDVPDIQTSRQRQRVPRSPRSTAKSFV